MFAPAPALPPLSLETAFFELRLAAKPKEDPVLILLRAAPPAEKLAALERLHNSLPLTTPSRRKTCIEALRVTAMSGAEAPAVRSKAVMYLGYSVPVADDEGTRTAAVIALLDAASSPAYRIFALRGLSSAAHALPPGVEGIFQETLLGLLAKSLTDDERVTAFLALDSFVRSWSDLPKRRPDLVAGLEASLLAPIEAAPAAFASNGSPSERLLALAVVWHAARHRAANDEPAALARVNALLTTLAPLETAANVKSQIAAFLAAEPPSPNAMLVISSL